MEVTTMTIELDDVERAYLLVILEDCEADLPFSPYVKFGAVGVSVIKTVKAKLEN
jgi:hypothetical protein